MKKEVRLVRAQRVLIKRIIKKLGFERISEHYSGSLETEYMQAKYVNKNEGLWFPPAGLKIFAMDGNAVIVSIWQEKYAQVLEELHWWLGKNGKLAQFEKGFENVKKLES